MLKRKKGYLMNNDKAMIISGDKNENKPNNVTDNANKPKDVILESERQSNVNGSGVIITDNQQNNKNISRQQLPLKMVCCEKKKNFLKYLFGFLTGCIALLCLYFFIKVAIVKAIITLIATIIMLIISIVITKCLNDDEGQKQVNTAKIPNGNNFQRDQSNEIEYQPNQIK